MTESNFILIERYLTGDLNSAEKADFETQVVEQNSLKSDFDTYKHISNIMDFAVEEEYRDLFQDIDKETEANHNSNNRNRFIILAVALGIITLLVTFMLKSSVDRVELAKQFAMYDQETVIRSSAGKADVSKSLLESYYDKLNSANASIATKDFDKAREAINGITEQYVLTRENKEWMLAVLDYAANGRKGEVFSTTLNKILDNPNHNCYPLAVKMNNEVNCFWGRLSD